MGETSPDIVELQADLTSLTENQQSAFKVVSRGLSFSNAEQCEHTSPCRMTSAIG